MFDAIIVIAQYARDQALASVSPRRMDHEEHIICQESSKNGKLVRITILRLPDNTYKQVWAGLACTACMRRRADIHTNGGNHDKDGSVRA